MWRALTLQVTRIIAATCLIYCAVQRSSLETEKKNRETRQNSTTMSVFTVDIGDPQTFDSKATVYLLTITTDHQEFEGLGAPIADSENPNLRQIKVVRGCCASFLLLRPPYFVLLNSVLEIRCDGVSQNLPIYESSSERNAPGTRNPLQCLERAYLIDLMTK